MARRLTIVRNRTSVTVDWVIVERQLRRAPTKFYTKCGSIRAVSVSTSVGHRVALVVTVEDVVRAVSGMIVEPEGITFRSHCEGGNVMTNLDDVDYTKAMLDGKGICFLGSEMDKCSHLGDITMPGRDTGDIEGDTDDGLDGTDVKMIVITKRHSHSDNVGGGKMESIVVVGKMSHKSIDDECGCHTGAET